MGPFHNWPTGSGLEYFYGFIGGEAHQYYPAIYEGTIPVEPEKTPEEGYHFMADMTDKAIKWVRQQKALMPDKPFFAYFRARRYARAASRDPRVVRQVQGQVRRRLGRAPRADLRQAEGTRRHSGGGRADSASRGDPPWDDMPEELKPVLRRQMEVYAGFLEFTDHHVGRLIDAIEDLGVLENTLVYYIIGDNGASAEGTFNGTYNERGIRGSIPHG